MENFKYNSEADKPRKDSFGLQLQIGGTKRDINKLKRKINKGDLTSIEMKNAEYTLKYFENLLSIYQAELEKYKKQESYVNADSFTWKDDMQTDKSLFLKEAKEQILNGNKMYRDLYTTNTFAFLAPDNYETDENDDIIVSEETQLGQASKEFDKICKDIRNHFVWACTETDKLDLIDKTAGWRVRDFISEAMYQADQYDRDSEHRKFAMWKRVVNVGTQILTDEMTCKEEHMSRYDKF